MTTNDPTSAAAEHLQAILDAVEDHFGPGWAHQAPQAATIADHAVALAKLTAPATEGGDSEHLAAIRSALVQIVHRERLNDDKLTHADAIIDHAKALAADNAALRARLAEADETNERLTRELNQALDAARTEEAGHDRCSDDLAYVERKLAEAEARVKRCRKSMAEALRRHDAADAENEGKGFVRGSVAWAMADDLRIALKDTNGGDLVDSDDTTPHLS